MELVVRLKQDEQVQVDPARLAALYADVGASESENMICRAMEELAFRIEAIETHFAAGDQRAIAKAARGIVGMAEEIGLVGLAAAANNLAASAKHCDKTAMAATLARLIRIGERSLTEIWDIKDLSV